MGDQTQPWLNNGDYVLSCLDCHEPHGSSNPYMLRTTVNGVSGLTYDTNDNTLVQNWCEVCHWLVPEYNPIHFSFRPYCTDCHTHGGDYPN
jgi:hypothetical protein